MNILSIDVPERQARDAARLAIQSAVAAAAMFTLMEATGLPEKFVGVLSAVLVVQPSVGNTLGEAWDRFAATVVGSIIGIVCLLLLPGGYGTAAALAFSMLVINAIAGFRPEWRYGVVAAVALSLGSGTDITQTAIDRSVAIGVGVVLGAIVTLIIWPDTAPKRAWRHLRSALNATADRLDNAVESALTDQEGDAHEMQTRYHQNLESAGKAASAIRLGESKPIEKQIKHTEKLYNSVLILNRVAEETDTAAGQEKELQDTVDKIRKLGYKIIKAFAEKEGDQNEALEKINAALSHARDLPGEATLESRDRIFRDALIFGLGEVVDSLKDLNDAFITA